MIASSVNLIYFCLPPGLSLALAEACKFTPLLLKTMYDNDSKGISYTAGFFMLIAFAVGGIILASALSGLVWQQVTGRSFTEMAEGLKNPAYSDVMKVVQTLTAVVGFFLPTVAAAFLLHKRPIKLLGFTGTGFNMRQVGLVVLLIGFSLLVATSLSYLTNSMPIPDSWKLSFDKLEEEYNRQVSAIISLKNAKDYILALIIMAFIPAVCEETLFRGGLQNFLSRGTGLPWLSIILVSILFSLAHFSFYGFLSRFFLGLVLGALFHYSGKLWLSILGHFINNALAITVLYYSIRQGRPLEEAMKQDATSFWGILAIPVVMILFVAFKRASDNSQPA